MNRHRITRGRAIGAAVLLALATFLFLQRQDRLENERRLGAIASEVAGRDVEVRCPGLLARVFEHEITHGQVQFDAEGRPAGHTDLRSAPCAALDEFAEDESKEAADLAAAADAVNTLAHEAFHLGGERDEARTECLAVQTIAFVAQQLGASADQGRAMAQRQWNVRYPDLPDRYRAADCRDGGPLDLRPASAVWP